MDQSPPNRIGRVVKLVGSGMALSLGTTSSGGLADEQQIAYGEYLSAECVTCHRLSGEVDGIPSIIGWSPEQFMAVMHAYKFKALDNVTMQTIAARLSEEELSALAAYFARVKMP